MLRPWQPGTEISIRFVISLTFAYPECQITSHIHPETLGEASEGPSFPTRRRSVVISPRFKNSIGIPGYTCLQCVRVAHDGWTCLHRATWGKLIITEKGKKNLAKSAANIPKYLQSYVFTILIISVFWFYLAVWRLVWMICPSYFDFYSHFVQFA